MNRYLLMLFALLCWGCRAHVHEVSFQYYNMGASEIRVLDIQGVSVAAAPGVLSVDHHEGSPLEGKCSTFFEKVYVGKKITVIWQEDNSSHEAELKRDELGLPAELKWGRVRFSYLGDGQWRVNLVE